MKLTYVLCSQLQQINLHELNVLLDNDCCIRVNLVFVEILVNTFYYVDIQFAIISCIADQNTVNIRHAEIASYSYQITFHKHQFTF